MKEAFQEQLATLAELQGIDIVLHQAETSIKAFPERLRDVEEAYLALKNEMDALKSECAESESSRRNDEGELASSIEHLREREAKLYAIKTNKEYQASLKEIAEGKRINREREERVLASMEKIEALTQKSTQLEGEFAEKKAAYDKRCAELESEEKTLRAKMDEAHAKRPDVEAKLDKEVRRKYDVVRRRHPNAAVAITSATCVGCSTRLPPQLYNEMLRRESVKICPNCQRLLFVPEEKKEEETETNDA